MSAAHSCVFVDIILLEIWSVDDRKPGCSSSLRSNSSDITSISNNRRNCKESEMGASGVSVFAVLYHTLHVRITTEATLSGGNLIKDKFLILLSASFCLQFDLVRDNTVGGTTCRSCLLFWCCRCCYLYSSFGDL